MAEPLKLPKVGNLAPVFQLKNQLGEKISLKDFRGQKNVVLYFYPKAMTPGCTTQAQCLRDSQKALKKHDAVVFGVSPDSVERLKKFAEKEGVRFDFLSDEDHKVANKYGVWGVKKLYGREYMGIHRTTFLIDKEGRLRHIMEKVKVKTHHDDVIEVLKEM